MVKYRAPALLVPLSLSVMLAIAPALLGQERRRDQHSSPIDERLRRANELYDRASALERAGVPELALDAFRQTQCLFPSNPIVHYRIGLVLKKLKRQQEAIRSLRDAIEAGLTDPELADARAQIEDLLWPALDPQRRDRFNEALDYLQVAQDLQNRIGADPKDQSYQELARKGIELLTGLLREVPDYSPIHARLGLARELLGDRAGAYLAYDAYLRRCREVDFAPSDLREIRRRKIGCELEFYRVRAQRYRELIHEGDTALGAGDYVQASNKYREAGNYTDDGREVSQKLRAVEEQSKAPAPSRAEPATLIVLLPPAAELQIDGKTLALTGERRRIETPPLSPGRTYVAHFRARWTDGGREVAKEQIVSLRAGQTRTIDLRPGQEPRAGE